ncbi:MAG: transposase [Veillonellales bacterium]
MSRTRRNFSAKFKSELILELLKGEKDLNTIATENKIQPNLLRNWKKEFLDKASIVFDDSREENLKRKARNGTQREDSLCQEGRPAHHAGGLVEKKSEELFGPDYESQYSPKPFED